MSHASEQAKPDFSGKWTETGVAASAAATTMVVSQDPDSITIDYGQGLRWTFKLDGSQSRNVTTQNNRQVQQFSTATWDGSRLVISTAWRSNREGPSTLREVWALEGANLVLTTTQISETTKGTLREFKRTFSK
jgi:hypothetical protein